MGFVLTLMGLGGAVNASLAGSLIGRVGWRHTALIFDLLVWIFALPLGLSLIKERIPAEPCKPEQGSVGTGGVTLSQAARSPQFYLLCSAVFLNMAVGNAVLANIVLHIFELGHGLRFATSVMSLLVLANLIARPVIGNISDWTSIRFGALLSFGCLGLSVFVLLLAKSKVLLLLVGLLAGLGYGGSIVMVGVVTAAIFGSRALGRILGFVVLSLGAGSACGTLLVGRIFDRTGSYQLGFLMLLVFAMSSVVAISRVRPQPLRTLKPLPEAQLSRVALAPRRNR